jgi:hypothetical protein
MHLNRENIVPSRFSGDWQAEFIPALLFGIGNRLAPLFEVDKGVANGWSLLMQGQNMHLRSHCRLLCPLHPQDATLSCC